MDWRVARENAAHSLPQGVVKMTEAERKAWNDAIEAAARIVEGHGADCREAISALGSGPAIEASAAASHGACKVAAGYVRALAKPEAGE